jgi:hypothetical protein
MYSTYPYGYDYYPYNNYTYSYPYNYQYSNQYYTQPTVTYASKYVPSLPNTGYAPVEPSTIAFMILFVAVIGAILYPHVRKIAAAALN